MFRQLRWRIVAANMVVVAVGVAIILLMAYLLTRVFVPRQVAASASEFAALARAGALDGASLENATAGLIDAFRQSLVSAVWVAAAGAIVAGLASSLLLAREILRPLREIAQSSRRIADGHYDERIAVPSSDELAQVATHFNEMAEALAQVEATRVALIGDVSHELRTPLTSLDGYLEGMLDGVFPTNDETLALMYQEVRRLRRLVDDLQTLSRVEAGQLSLQIETFDLGPIVERAVAQLAPQATAQALALETELPATAVVVCADPDRTAQILLNLLGNAMRYTPENGRVTARLRSDSRFAHVDIVDTGIGLAPEDMPYIFERFYRVDRSRTRASGGSGIGLTISRHLAWAMGGDLAVHSDGPGMGSTFGVTLPLAPEDRA